MRSGGKPGTSGRFGAQDLRRLGALALLCGLASCGGGTHTAVTSGGFPAFRAPGPASDPWGPYVAEAARRFDVPQNWIRAVMRQESGGREYLHGQPITSDAGAAGLMQLMPPTYAELAARYNLGSNPYEPHDNIMAGTAYIKELYTQYGSPAFLAAYDAGPHRVDTYLQGRGALPNETVNYLASVAPLIARDRPVSGPLAAYADTGGLPAAQEPIPRAYAAAPVARCWQDPNAAYDPDASCRSALQAAVRMAAATPSPSGWGRGAPTLVRSVAADPARACWHDPDAAYDPSAPCQTRPAPRPIAPLPHPVMTAYALAHCWHDPNAAYDPTAPCGRAPVQTAEAAPPPQLPAWITHAPSLQRRTEPVQLAEAPARRTLPSTIIPSASAATVRPMPRPAIATGGWSIQLGAFADAARARRTAESVRSLAPRELGGARSVLGTTSPFGGHVLYRARLQGLSARTASAACSELAAHAQACVTVPPGG